PLLVQVRTAAAAAAGFFGSRSPAGLSCWGGRVGVSTMPSLGNCTLTHPVAEKPMTSAVSILPAQATRTLSPTLNDPFLPSAVDEGLVPDGLPRVMVTDRREVCLPSGLCRVSV